MKNAFGKLVLGLAAAALLGFAPSASADSASMVLTGAGTNPVDGIYVGPYYATVNGVANTPIICDDFKDDSYIGESYTANISPETAPSGTFFSGQHNYDAVSALAEQLFATNNNTTAAKLQYAIWYIFDPTDVTNWLTTTSPDPTLLAAAIGLANGAEAATYTPGQFSDIKIYTPNLSDPIKCGTGSCPTAPPQEFIVKTPEASTVLLLGFGLFAIGIFGRRKLAAMSAAV